jgi:hypothetical protein
MLHPAIQLAEHNTIHGKGLVTTAFIPAGAIVWQREPAMKTVPLKQFQTWSPEQQAEYLWFAFQCSSDELLLCEGTDRYMNHSCDPNTWWQDDNTLVASRAIYPGEEVTYDYATTELSLDLAMPCACGTATCRGLITNQDYLIPGWQQRYGEHLPGFVLQAIRANSDH